MTKWEYAEVYYGPDFLSRPADYLNKFGKGGWELTAVLAWGVGHKFILKRPLPKPESVADSDHLGGSTEMNSNT